MIRLYLERCFSLNLRCHSEGSCVQRRSFSKVIGDHDLGNWTFSPIPSEQTLLCILLSGCHEMNSFPVPSPSAMMFLPCLKPKNSGAGQSWIEDFETVSQNKLSSFKLFFYSISRGNLTYRNGCGLRPKNSSISCSHDDSFWPFINY